jgi:hypothetical protein
VRRALVHQQKPAAHRDQDEAPVNLQAGRTGELNR